MQRLSPGLALLVSAALALSQAQLGLAQPANNDAVKKAIAQIADLQQRIGKNSNNAELHYLLANAYVTVGRADLATEEYKNCMRLGPGSQAATYAVIALGKLQAGSVMSSVSQSARVSSVPKVNEFPARRPPQISHIDYLSAPPGQSVTVAGSGFSAKAREIEVLVGGIPARVTSTSPTSVTFLLPEMTCPMWNVPVKLTVKDAPGEASTTINLQTRVIPNEQ